MEKKKAEQYDELYDRWGTSPGAIVFGKQRKKPAVPKKPTAKKGAGKPVKKK